ncbi:MULTISPECIES: DUF4184 family protein [Streptomyces]|uniref:DUF4184 family protein n=1 Tax=Streptomyces solicathayae TaxID=3081768 RepID=A0ABZ0LZS4_9ACTN|nr:DUF4184 family protein [Streptomyces sp. HUAS YS2]WOX25015.1 DUF4184 family protein [Streptomyces sp. HUAS YS2]
MPFTLSHAAAVLPGIRRDGSGRGPLLPSALVAGSFAPDMTYYAASVFPAAMPFGDVTHALWGVVTVDVAITAALVGLWLMVREPMVALAPERWRGRVLGFVRGGGAGGRSAPALRWFVPSAVIGAATHVVWDSFTHLDRWGTRAIPVLGDVVAGFPVYTYLQYGGSAVALAVLAWFVGTGLRSVRPVASDVPALTRRGRWAAWSLLGACVAVGVVHRCVRWYAYWGGIETPLDIVPTACFGAGAGLAAGLVLYGAGARWVWRRGDAREDAQSTTPHEPEPAAPSQRV